MYTLKCPATRRWTEKHLESKTLSGACPVAVDVLSPEVQQLECEVGHSPASGGEVEMSGAMPLLPHVPLWHGQGQLYLCCN